MCRLVQSSVSLSQVSPPEWVDVPIDLFHVGFSYSPHSCLPHHSRTLGARHYVKCMK